MTALGGFRILFTLAILGLVLLLGGALVENNPMQTIGLLLFVFGMLFVALISSKAHNEGNWVDLGLGTAKTCPKNKQEWELLFHSGWTERMLISKARNASGAFAWREDQKRILEAYSQRVIKGPEELKVWRSKTKESKKMLAQKIKIANRYWKEYTDTWDLFKRNSVLPKKIGTGGRWDDPDEFRKAAEAADWKSV